MKRLVMSLISLCVLVMCGCCAIQPIQKQTDFSESFVFIEVVGSAEVCDDKGCSSVLARGSGSGFLIEDMFVEKTITAAHVCELQSILVSQGMTNVKIQGYDIDGHMAEMFIVKTDPVLDLCMLTSEGLTSAKPIMISQVDPIRGEHATLYGAPLGVWSPGLVLQFDGYMAGNATDPMERDCVRTYYSIFGKPGVSGGMIVNDAGQVIGVAIMAHSGISQMVIAVTHEDIVKFLS